MRLQILCSYFVGSPGPVKDLRINLGGELIENNTCLNSTTALDTGFFVHASWTRPVTLINVVHYSVNIVNSISSHVLYSKHNIRVSQFINDNITTQVLAGCDDFYLNVTTENRVGRGPTESILISRPLCPPKLVEVSRFLINMVSHKNL